MITLVAVLVGGHLDPDTFLTELLSTGIDQGPSHFVNMATILIRRGKTTLLRLNFTTFSFEMFVENERKVYFSTSRLHNFGTKLKSKLKKSFCSF